MLRRHAERIRTLAFTSLLVLILAAPAVAHAASTGTGDWYWPVATENFRGWDGWWVYRSGNHSWHMAQDMPVAPGHTVYAIGDGTVIESKPDSGYGGVLVVLHRTGDGHYFKAVYGHMYRGAGTSVGSKVKAGQAIGRVNGARHLHFGIHPGKAYPSDNNPFRGHTYTRGKTYGWTDPVAYLRDHPRTLTYRAPALPALGTYETSATPIPLGVADGRVYWTIGTAEPATVFSHSLDGTEPPAPVPSAPPVLAHVGFTTVVTTSTITVYDARPAVTLVLSHSTPSWGRSISISGRVTNAIGQPFIGAPLLIEASADGVTWSRVASATAGLSGTYALSYAPSRRVALRAAFPATKTYASGASRVATVAPHVSVTAPSLPASVDDDDSFSIRGTVVPRHAEGTGGTVLRLQRRAGTTWVDDRLTATRYADSASGSAYSCRLRLAEGAWRVRAETPADDRHAGSTTSWITFSVR